jgi:hypothetical protein
MQSTIRSEQILAHPGLRLSSLHGKEEIMATNEQVAKQARDAAQAAKADAEQAAKIKAEAAKSKAGSAERAAQAARSNKK